MWEASHESAAADGIDPDELVAELRGQIRAVRSRVEAYRETMLAAGLTRTGPAEPGSWGPRTLPAADDAASPSTPPACTEL
jgi:hypothetical protein